MSPAAVVPGPGFAEPSRDAQRCFRAILDAFAHPTRVYPLVAVPRPPRALGGALAAVALTLLDEDTAVWLADPLCDDEVLAWLTFHTGARRSPAAATADFVLCTPATRPALDVLSLGTDEAPHLSATVVLDTRGDAGDASLPARGPGIDGTATLRARWADGRFAGEWRENADRFPRGVDVLAVDGSGVIGLPRTTRLSAAGS